MTQHFLPDYHHWSDISSEVEGLITVPIIRQPKIVWRGAENCPFYVFGCTWFHVNSQGPLTKEKFEEDRTGAIVDFTNELNAMGQFLAYPITYDPPMASGVAYHDWVGAAYPFDLRVVIALDEQIQTGESDDEGIPIIEAGLKFHLLSLVAKVNHHDIGK